MCDSNVDVPIWNVAERALQRPLVNIWQTALVGVVALTVLDSARQQDRLRQTVIVKQKDTHRDVLDGRSDGLRCVVALVAWLFLALHLPLSLSPSLILHPNVSQLY